MLIRVNPAFTIMDEVDYKVVLTRIADDVIRDFVEDDENRDNVEIIAKSQTAGFFTGQLKREIIAVYQRMREQGCLPDTLINEHENCQKLYGTTDAIDSEAGIDDINRILMKAIEETSIKLICQLHQRYSQYKKRENLVDFNDLELMTVKLLENEDIRMHYFNRFAAIMVDEFQDLNPLQKEILDLLTQKDGHIPPGRLFIVGLQAIHIRLQRFGLQSF